MSLRIGYTLLVFLILSGFTFPELPTESRGIYRFKNANQGESRNQFALHSTTSDASIEARFQLTVGFRPSVFRDLSESASRQDKAKALVDFLAKNLDRFHEGLVNVSVSDIYVDIREVILDVEVSASLDAARVRTELLKKLNRRPETLFAGEPSIITIE
ncbi:MAG: hypothetical protein AB1540_10505 [Bdellovibrionota bacterium]